MASPTGVQGVQLDGAENQQTVQAQSGEQTSDQTQDSQGQPTQSQPPQPRINLNEIPEFRAWQSAADQRFNQLRDTNKQLLDRIEQFEQQHAQTLKPEDRHKFELEKERRGRAQAESQLRDMQGMQEKARKLGEISQTTGVPLEHINMTGTVEDAWRSAWQWQQQNSSAQSAPNVDVGSGQPPPSKAEEFRRRYKEARESKNAMEMLRVTNEAAVEGIPETDYK